MQVHIEGKQ